MPKSTENDHSRRPRVVILGGGFAGVGAATKLKDADADVVLVDKHDYHTFQPLLYQFATGLLETTAVGHALRDLFHDQDERDRPPGDRHRGRSGRARGAVRRHGAADVRLPRVRRSGPRSTSSAPRARRSTRSRCTRSPTPCGSRTTSWSAGRRPTGIPSSSTTARSTSSSWAAARPGSRAPARSPSSTAPTSPRTIRTCPQDKARVILVEAGPTLFPMFKEDIREYTEKALAKRDGRGDGRRGGGVDLSDAGDAEVGQP